MKIDLSICKADEVIGRINIAAQIGAPIDGVISIEHPGSENLTASQGRAPRLTEELGDAWARRQLILSCWDVEHTGFGVPLPHQEIITRSIAFVERLAPKGRPLRLLVHCRAGKARSTALGLVLLQYQHGRTVSPEQTIAELLRVRPEAAPNLAIVRHGDDFLEYGGSLTAAVEAHPGISDRRAAAERARMHQVESRRATGTHPTP